MTTYFNQPDSHITIVGEHIRCLLNFKNHVVLSPWYIELRGLHKC